MWIMSAHEMMTLGASVSGTVDASYDNDDLCDGDPATPVRVTSGSVELAITGTSQAVNGLIIANHNLNQSVVATFSGLGTVTMPIVPPGAIRYNGGTILTPAVTVGSTTLTLTAGGPAVIGEALAGLYREVWTLPPEVDHGHTGFGILPSGEYPMLGYSKGAQARRFGGSVWLTDLDYGIIRNAYLASRENSLPTAIIPFPDETGDLDPWLVTWESFNPKPGPVPDTWSVDVAWAELPRYRWPV
jgi:hypothetical protein